MNAHRHVTPHNRGRLLLIIALGMLVLIVAHPHAVSAHARLISSSPAAGGAVTTAPTELLLHFSEPVERDFIRVELLTSDGVSLPLLPIATTDSTNQNLLIRPADPATWSNGVYTLLYRVISGIDGHPTSGSLVFSVGSGVQSTGSTVTGDEEAAPPWLRIGLRWLLLLSLLIVAGGFAARLLVARSVWDQPAFMRSARQSWLTIWRVAIIVAVVSQIASLHNQAIVVTDAALFSISSRQTYLDILFDSTFGTAWLLRTIILLLLLIVVVHYDAFLSSAYRWSLAGLSSAAMLFTLPISGHAAGETVRTRAIGVDWFHLVTAAVWFGGLVLLLPALISLRNDRTEHSALIATTLLRRYSTVALVAVGLLATSGVVNATYHVAGPRSLRNQDYGLTLIAKHLLIFIVAVPALLNLLIVVPRLRAASNHQASNHFAVVNRLVRVATGTVAVEIALVAMIILASARLTELPPADAPLTTEVAPRIVTIDQRATVAETRIWLVGQLNSTATDRFSVTIAQPAASPPLQRLIVEATLPASGERSGVTDRFDAEPLPRGTTYVFPTVRLSLQGIWTLAVIVRRAGVDDLRATFTVDTRQAGLPPPRFSADRWQLPRIPVEAWGLFALAVIIALGGVVGVKRLPGLEPLAATLIITMVLLITAGFTVSAARLTIPVTASTDLINPVADDDASAVVRGQSLYVAHCLSCHGPAGAGDETDDPAHGHGSAADLTRRRVRLQRDGDLFFGITYGVPGSEMPAYEVALTDAERWDLVAYLRALQRSGPIPETSPADE